MTYVTLKAQPLIWTFVTTVHYTLAAHTENLFARHDSSWLIMPVAHQENIIYATGLTNKSNQKRPGVVFFHIALLSVIPIYLYIFHLYRCISQYSLLLTYRFYISWRGTRERGKRVYFHQNTVWQLTARHEITLETHAHTCSHWSTVYKHHDMHTKSCSTSLILLLTTTH